MKGFTLAEVLITLGIIGVIAALTVPVLMQNIQDQQLKTAWKKVYSVFNSAQQRIMSDNASTMLGYAGGAANVARDAFLNYVLYQKKCDYQQALGNCWHQTGVVTYLDGTKDSATETDPIWGWNRTAGAILKDGTYVLFSVVNINCDWSANAVTYNICSSIIVDVNGAKPPNVLGRDIFEMFVTVNSMKPYGAGRPSSDLNTNCSKTSHANLDCSALYLTQ